jgi:hypothetical protein
VRTLVPAVINKSTQDTITLEVRNDGSDSASVTVDQGEGSWSADVPAGSTKNIYYPVIYDAEGNYTLPDPLVKFSMYGEDAYTMGRGASVLVKYIEGAGAPEAVSQEAAAAVVEAAPELEKEELSFAEYEAAAERKRVQQLIKYTMIIVGFIVLVIVAMFYISYRRKKGPAMPFMEMEKR